jgi:hypothetical protein
LKARRKGKSASHDYATADREVLIHVPIGTIELAVGWFPYAIKFGARSSSRASMTFAQIAAFLPKMFVGLGHKDFLQRLHHKDMPQQFECMLPMTANRVKLVPQQIPNLGSRPFMRTMPEFG